MPLPPVTESHVYTARYTCRQVGWCIMMRPWEGCAGKAARDSSVKLSPVFCCVRRLDVLEEGKITLHPSAKRIREKLV